MYTGYEKYIYRELEALAYVQENPLAQEILRRLEGVELLQQLYQPATKYKE